MPEGCGKVCGKVWDTVARGLPEGCKRVATGVYICIRIRIRIRIYVYVYVYIRTYVCASTQTHASFLFAARPTCCRAPHARPPHGPHAVRPTACCRATHDPVRAVHLAHHERPCPRHCWAYAVRPMRCRAPHARCGVCRRRSPRAPPGPQAASKPRLLPHAPCATPHLAVHLARHERPCPRPCRAHFSRTCGLNLLDLNGVGRVNFFPVVG